MVATVRPCAVPVCGVGAQCLGAALTSRRQRMVHALNKQGWRQGTALRGTPSAVQGQLQRLWWRRGSQRCLQALRECTALERCGSASAGQCMRCTAGLRPGRRLRSALCSACKLPWPLFRAAWKPRGARWPPGEACPTRAQPCKCEAVLKGLCPRPGGCVRRWALPCCWRRSQPRAMCGA